MANEKIEIDIVLNDGSIAKGFAEISNSAQKAASSAASSFNSVDSKLLSVKQTIDAVVGVSNNLNKSIDRSLRQLDLQAAFANKSLDASSAVIRKIAQDNERLSQTLSRSSRQADLTAAFAGLPKVKTNFEQLTSSISSGFQRANSGFISFQNTVSSGFSRLTNSVFSFKSLLIATGAFLVARKVVGFFESAIDEAVRGQDAVNRLAVSLNTAGTFSEEAVKSFTKLAKGISETTKFSADAVLTSAALARNFTKTNEQAEQLVKAAIELSAARDIGLDDAVNQLGGTLTGTAGRLNKFVPELNGLTEASLKAGGAIDVVLNRFSGSAAGQINTFSGAIALAKNQFNNFLQDLGNQIIRNPTFIAALSGLGKLFSNITSQLSGNVGKSRGLIDGIVLAGVDGFLLLTKAIVFSADSIDKFKLSLVSVYAVLLKGNQIILDIDNAITKVGSKLGTNSKQDYENSLALSAQNKRRIAEVEELGVAIADSQLKNAGRFQFLTQEVEKFKQSVVSASKQVGLLPEFTSPTGGNRAPQTNIIDTKAVQEQALAIENLRDKVFDSISDIYGEINAVKTIDLSDTFEQLGLAAEAANATTSAQIGNVKAKLEEFKTGILATTKQISTAISNGLSNTIVSGIKGFVTALVNGENAFKAFASNILGIIGDLAQQIGGFIIAAGVAKAALFSGNPATTIAAGVALVAIGAALSALNERGKKGGFAGAAEGSSLTPPLTPAQPISGEDQFSQPQSKVNVIIQGNVFDSDATGLRIATILKEQGFANAVRV